MCPGASMPIQMMSSDGACLPKFKKKPPKKKRTKSCSSSSDDECNPLTDQKYSLADIVKIVKRLKAGDDKSAAKIVASKLKRCEFDDTSSCKSDSHHSSDSK